MDDDSIILRIHEGYNERKTVTLTFDNEINEAYILDLLENKVSSLDINGNQISFEILPFEIITLGIK